MNFEELFNLAIYALINHNGGSLEESMDDMNICDEETRNQIITYMNWYDEEEYEEDEED